MDKKVIYLDDVLEAIESCEHYPLFDNGKMSIGIVDFIGLVIKYLDIKEAIEQLPSAQPEIIRCKDCKFYKKEFGWNGAEYTVCGISPSYHPIRFADNFCSYSERRTDG